MCTVVVAPGSAGRGCPAQHSDPLPAPLPGPAEPALNAWVANVADPLLSLDAKDLLEALAAVPTCLPNLQVQPGVGVGWWAAEREAAAAAGPLSACAAACVHPPPPAPPPAGPHAAHAVRHHRRAAAALAHPCGRRCGHDHPGPGPFGPRCGAAHPRRCHARHAAGVGFEGGAVQGLHVVPGPSHHSHPAGAPPSPCPMPHSSHLQLLLHYDDNEVLRSATAYLRTLLQVRGWGGSTRGGGGRRAQRLPVAARLTLAPHPRCVDRRRRGAGLARTRRARRAGGGATGGAAPAAAGAGGPRLRAGGGAHFGAAAPRWAADGARGHDCRRGGPA